VSHRKASVTDYKKPLFVAAGNDSLAAIDLDGLPRGASSRPTLDDIKEAFVGRFPQSSWRPEESFEETLDDPNFIEPMIDRLRLQREQVRAGISLRRGD
jgi:dynein light intermediate chain 2